MRDSPFRPGQDRSDPIERLFVATAIISLIGFAIWFAFFAGAPLAPGRRPRRRPHAGHGSRSVDGGAA
jgi:hypothetical protein